MKFSFFLFNLSFAFLFVFGLWALDIGVSGMLLNGVVSNGWWIRSSIQHYHLGLFSVFVAFVSVLFYNVFYFEKKVVLNEKEKRFYGN